MNKKLNSVPPIVAEVEKNDADQVISSRQTIPNPLVGHNLSRNGSGYLVETKFGNGRVYHKESLINGKIPVFFEDGRKILFSEQNLKLIGFVD